MLYAACFIGGIVVGIILACGLAAIAHGLDEQQDHPAAEDFA